MGEQRTALILLMILSFVISTPQLVEAAEDDWVSKASMNEARAYLGVAVVDRKIYAIGGDQGSLVGNAMPAEVMTQQTTNATEEYNPNLDIWTIKSPMPTARARLGTAVYQNKIYCIGGYSASWIDGGLNYFELEANEVYDPATDTWESKAPLPTPRLSPATNMVNGKIYVIGGYSITTQSILNVAEVYDPTNDTWTTISPPPLGVESVASTVVDNKIYALGKNYSDWQTYIQVYDPLTDNWTIKGSTPVRAFADAAVTTGSSAPERIYFFDENRTDIYNPIDDSWVEGTPAPTDRPLAVAAVIDDLIYLVGGRTGQWGYITFMDPSALCEQYIPIGYIPEFPSWIILPLLIVLTLVVLIVRNRLKRKALAYCLLLSLGISIFVSTGFSSIAKANPIPLPEKLPVNQAYIRSNGDIDPAILPIERSGNTYFLNEDIANYSIAVEKDGIVIDGNNFMLTLPSYGESGEDGQVKTAIALVSITNMSNITVKNLEFSNCETGISVINSSKISIIQNTIISKNGIFISSSGNCSIARNVINSTYRAINPHQSLHLDIEYNKITHHGTSPSGISYGITNNVNSSNIIGNLFSDYYIALYNIGSFNRIVGNSFENNFFGILHNAPALPFEGNEIYHNNFINNTHPLALSYGSSILDDGKEGNYWSNYNGTDNDGDGIGDKPFVIPTITISNNETNTDNYPLMNPVEIEVIPEFPLWIILPLFLSATISVIFIKKRMFQRS